jgi:glycosyltransferase involved in cell wall biosynthesis
MSTRTEGITVCSLVPYPLETTPSQRFRIEQWSPYWCAQGIAVELVPFIGKWTMGLLHQRGRRLTKATALGLCLIRRAASIARIRHYDVVVIHRAACIVGPAILEKVIRLVGKPVIFDFDDAIWMLHTSAANRYFGWLKFPGKTAAICRLSSHVVVGNQFLSRYARQYCRHVTVVPSSVDTDRFRPTAKLQSGKKVIIGWSGSSTSQTYLELFLPMVRRLAALPGVEFRVHSDRRPELPGVACEWRKWHSETEAAEIAEFDIGLMPMPDDPWALGKCAMKALLYMSAGIPVVCSPVGANCEVVRHGENGFLANSTDEWVNHVHALVADAPLRKKMGEAGRQTVVDSYSMRVCADRFATVIRETVRIGASATRTRANSVALPITSPN